MTMDAQRRRAHAKVAALREVRSIRRPVTPDSASRFDLYYVRSGPRGKKPVVIIPGGPGGASIVSYQRMRRRAADSELDVIMVEHRGVGMSRHDDAGADLPDEALTIDQVIDDIVAVLDDADVADAVIYGTSYGSYLAAGVGVRHPGRVDAMILDSPLLNRDDIEIQRCELRRLLWNGEEEGTADLAAKVRELADQRTMTPSDALTATVLYGIGGDDLLHRLFDLLLDGRRLLWTTLSHVDRVASRDRPFRCESDLVGPIGFRELNFHGTPDGLPLDLAVAIREAVDGEPAAFEGEPFDLVAAMPMFTWPTAVISGGRDLCTPPVVADRIAGLIPDAVLVRLATAGHSILDTREAAALRIATQVCAGRTADLPAAGADLDKLPPPLQLRLIGGAIEAAARVEGALPGVLVRLLGGSTS
jgi:pimeloyl-ACP methyl ester carboxylesterase